MIPIDFGQMKGCSLGLILHPFLTGNKNNLKAENGYFPFLP
jgi:hypothetical protein